jgi:hypothetical protein
MLMLPYQAHTLKSEFSFVKTEKEQLAIGECHLQLCYSYFYELT